MTATVGTSRLRPRAVRPSFRFSWPVFFLLLAVGVLLFYNYLFPHLSASSQGTVRTWLGLSSINDCLVWAICALGLNIVVGYAGLLDLGYVAFFAIGAYCSGWLMSGFFAGRNWNILGGVPKGTPGIHIAFWFVLIIAAVFTAIWGVLIGAPTLRLKSDYLAIVTLGFGEIIPQFFHNGGSIFGHNLTNGTQGITPIDSVKVFNLAHGNVKALGPFDLTWRYSIFCVLVAIVIFISLRIREGRLGRAWLAIREDELAASMMGVPLMRSKLAAYAVGAAAGGFGGVAYAVSNNAALPDPFTFQVSITLLAMVVLGGMGNVWGVLLGALMLEWVNNTGLPQIGNTVNSHLHTNWNAPSYSYLLFGSILVLMMLFRREGFIPEARTRMVLREQPRTEAEALGEDMEAIEDFDR
jgi:branched-chain amino acid transport system permease protein